MTRTAPPKLIAFGLAVLGIVAATTTNADQPPLKDEDRPWYLRTPVRPQVPPVKDGDWAKNPIDSFILAKQESAGLVPSQPADKLTLIRRVTFDLTGLPPTPEEVQAFLKDESPSAYELLVDRLLASPRYGERW